MRTQRASRRSAPKRDVSLKLSGRNLVAAAPEERKNLAQVREPWVRLAKLGERRRACPEVEQRKGPVEIRLSAAISGGWRDWLILATRGKHCTILSW